MHRVYQNIVGRWRHFLIVCSRTDAFVFFLSSSSSSCCRAIDDKEGWINWVWFSAWKSVSSTFSQNSLCTNSVETWCSCNYYATLVKLYTLIVQSAEHLCYFCFTFHCNCECLYHHHQQANCSFTLVPRNFEHKRWTTNHVGIMLSKYLFWGRNILQAIA